MKLSTFARLSTAIYQSGKSVYLRSLPGRGKTSTIEAVVPAIGKNLGKNLGFITVSGPNLQPGDTVGFGIPRHNPDATADMVFTRPFFWVTPEGKYLEEYDGGVLFIDEADKMDVDLKKVVGEMALSGRCGPHVLPPGWVVWMAGNRVGDRSGSTKELDHLINRRFEIDVEDDVQGWEEWAIKSGVHHSIVAFAVSNPQIVWADTLPEKQGPFCTPRSLVSTAQLLATLGGIGPDGTAVLPTDADAVEIAAAGIGQAAAAQMFATIRLEQELPSMEAIVKAPEKTPIPGAPDAQMLVCYKLASLATDKTLAPIITYVERMPADFAVTFAKSLGLRNPMFIASKPMLSWVQRNSAIMNLMAQLK